MDAPMHRLLAALLLLAFFGGNLFAEPPPLGLTARAEVTHVVDGDTVDVVLKLPLRIRLLDAWAPEPGEEGGPEATEHLESLIPVGSEAVLHVPSAGSRGLVDLMTFGRVLGHLWPKGGDASVSEQMVEAGHATEDRP